MPLTMDSRVDMCLRCHEEEPEEVHQRHVVRCSDCHLGDSLSSRKEIAHRGMVKNPGELKFASITCGRPGCHENQVKWVKNTLMATNRGIISTLRYYWGEAKDQYEDLTVKDLMENPKRTPALDYFSKLCGTCHLWLEKGKYPDFLKEKGGGCSACHLLSEERPDGSKKWHPRLVRQPPMDNCVRCHNRSGRIGLSYQGKYETEGYGTPFEQGDFTDNELEDGRYFRILKEDVHYEKGLICVDCHTQKETMGDGIKRAHMEEQLEVRCVDCHDPKLHPSAVKKGLKIEKDGNNFWFTRKKDKKKIKLSQLNPNKCRDRDHKRLSCQACHSTWVPQCFGCHVTQRKKEEQTDWLVGSPTPGRWQEYRSIMRYEAPSLGVYKPPHGEEEIVIIVPG
ncbi:Cytochrome c family protein [Dissulfuribacter thermophilus]|uniref:Cytochrome c family protein n=1 Tax=Dissulfuribacter thermophilus TaxID=1156395 RepID=A0A1B9F5T8_9BACT|nr:hypothetical protein [Dissulfuribacter thermophilus]OCC15299.1 Cytochrome c family protein [Dissulfuribacter thermophilus]